MSKDITNWEEPGNLALLKDQCRAQQLTDEEFKFFVHVCQKRQLNPLLNQIYAIKRQGKMTIQVGIDGLRALAERSGAYAPGRPAEFKYDGSGKLVSATAFVKKYVKGSWHEVGAEAFLEEFCVSYQGKPSGQWAKMPHVMLSKCAEANALRKAFSGEISGIYAKEEMEQAEDTDSSKIEPLKQPEEVPEDVNEKLGELQECLELEGVSSERLMEFLEDMSGTRRLSLAELINSALESKAIFIKHYKKWQEKGVEA